MGQVLFLKLGGSLITDKTGIQAARMETLARLAQEIATARQALPDLQLVLGHGSGSFGHVAAAEHETRNGVRTDTEWRAFARVSDAAARLNRLVVEALLTAGVPAVSLQPSASAVCDDGAIVSLAVDSVRNALSAGLVPVLYGDVAFDKKRGGTIISTEEVLMYLAQYLPPSWFLLAGETPGVFDLRGNVVQVITAENFGQIAPALGGSRGTDVTGGMVTKVKAMLQIVQTLPGCHVRIFSGLEPEALRQVLLRPHQMVGTEISHT